MPGGLPGSQEELAASLEALTANPAALRAAEKIAGKIPPPEGLGGEHVGPVQPARGLRAVRPAQGQEGRQQVAPAVIPPARRRCLAAGAWRHR